ncbi:hypothetical protein P43SY_005340 [Pythium insidiosum]|uniref:Cytochrome P450 n=1 Tax=Pythium insidiosum TaxID=114742 RepID=A0AAD5LNF4_PYTIN|nr:hypothetical protein P43SY_005340 [Pythium insidiosum]
MDDAVDFLAPQQLRSLLLPYATASTFAWAALVIVLLALAFPNAQFRAVSHLGRPRGTLPLLGNTFQAAITYRKRIHTYIYEEVLRHNGKPFVMSIITKPPMVVLATVETVEDVLKTQFDRFGKGYDFAEALRDLFGFGIFVTDGAKWHHQRKTASHLFSMQMMRDIMDHVMVEHTERLCDIVSDAATQGRELDMKHLLELYTTDVFCKIGFGVDLDFMRKDNHEFFERFGRVNSNLLYRNELPTWYWKLKQLLNIGIEKQQKEDIAYLDKFIYKIIEDSIQRKHTQPSTDSKKDVITLFLENPGSKLEGGSGEDYDVREIRDMAMAFISAGRDTTAYAMAWFVIMMSQYPEVQERIRQELWEKIPDLMEGKIKAPNKEQTADLTYLEATIKENLRLNAVLPLNTRTALEDVTLCDGTFLRAGTMVLLPAYTLSRLTNVWGPDATEFKPERWIDATTGKLIPVSPFKFLTFSAGPRICLGRQFSIMEMKIALAGLLSKFEIKTTKAPETFEYDPSLTLGIEGPIMVRPRFLQQQKH